MTEAEKLLWFYLKEGFEGCKFRRQHPFGIYIADFYCHKIRLILEIDGSIHDLSEVKKMMRSVNNGWKKTITKLFALQTKKF